MAASSLFFMSQRRDKRAGAPVGNAMSGTDGRRLGK
jgi:hypothetical protein